MEENEKCLKIHGYIFSSESESEPDDSKFEFDELYESFKPSPININPQKHKIIVIADTESNVSCYNEPGCTKEQNSSYSDILKKSSPQKVVTNGNSDGVSLSPDLQQNDKKKLSKGQRKRLRKKELKSLALPMKIDMDNSNETCDNVVETTPNYCDTVDYQDNFPSLGEVINTTNYKTVAKTTPKKNSKKSTSKKSQLNEDYLMEYEHSYLYYDYGNPDFESFISFKEHYLNGSISSFVNVNKEKKDMKTQCPTATNKDSLLQCVNNASYLYSVNVNKEKKDMKTQRPTAINKDSLLQCVDNASYLYSIMQYFQTEMIIKALHDNGLDNDIMNLIKFCQSDSFRMFEITQQYMKNLVQLGIRHNHVFTREQTKYLKFVSATILKVAYIYDSLLIHQDTLENFNKTAKITSVNERSYALYTELVFGVIKKTLYELILKKDYSELFSKVVCGEQNEEFLMGYKNLWFVLFNYGETIIHNSIDIVRLGYMILPQMEIPRKVKKTLHPTSTVAVILKECPDVQSLNKAHSKVTRTMKNATPKLPLHHNGLIITNVEKPENKCNRKYSTYKTANGEINTVHCTEKYETAVAKATDNYEFAAGSMNNIEATSSSSTGPNRKLSQPQLCQLIIEDLTENRKYFYDSTYQTSNSNSWCAFQNLYLNGDISSTILKQNLTWVMPLQNDIISNEILIKPSVRDNSLKDYLKKIWKYCYETSAFKTFIFYLFLKIIFVPWFLHLIVHVLVNGTDIIILISLLIYLCIQFVISC